MTPAKSTWQKKKEIAEDHKARKAVEATTEFTKIPAREAQVKREAILQEKLPSDDEMKQSSSLTQNFKVWASKQYWDQHCLLKRT